MKHIITALLLLVSVGVNAADSFTMWENQTFTGPFTDGIVAVSPTYATTTGNNAVKVHVKYESVTHSGAVPNVCDCEIRVVIEEEIAAGIWIPVASQHSEYRILDSGPQRVVILSPALNIDGASDENVSLPDGTEMRISRTQGSAPDSFRVRVIAREYAPGVLQSVTLSAYGRKFVE